MWFLTGVESAIKHQDQRRARVDESGLRERVKVDPPPGAEAGAGAGGAGGGESVAQRRDTRLYSRTRAQAGKRPSTHLNYCPPPPSRDKTLHN